MAKRGQYRSKQRELVIAGLKAWNQDFLTVNNLQEKLKEEGQEVGLTTIYRTLDLLEQDRLVAKIPATNGHSARYRYIGADSTSPYGRLHCLRCGASEKLNCRQLEALFDHIGKEHDFHISPSHTVFYGLCHECFEATAREGAAKKD